MCVGRGGGGEEGTKAEGGGINGLGTWVNRIARSLCSLSHVTSQKNLSCNIRLNFRAFLI